MEANHYKTLFAGYDVIGIDYHVDNPDVYKRQGQELVLNQVSDMKKHIGEVEKLYQDIRSLRHDMGNRCV